MTIKKRILLSGYFGYENFGDDILMKICFDFLDNLQCKKVIHVTAKPTGFDYVKMLCPRAEPIDFYAVRRGYFRNYDFVIFGGGGRLFNYATTLPPLGHAKLLLSDVLNYYVPKKLGTRFASIGVGLGPFRNNRIKRDVLRNLRCQDMVFVRDAESLSMGLDVAPNTVKPGHDLFFKYFETLRNMFQEKNKPDKIIIIYRNYKYGESDNKYINSVIKLSDHFETKGKDVVWVSFQEDYDEALSNMLKQRKKVVVSWDPRKMAFADLFGLIGEAECVVSARMHGVLVAGILGVPVVGVGLHPKLSLAAQYFGASASCVSDDPTVEELSSACRDVIGTSATAGGDAGLAAHNEVVAMFRSLETWILRN